MASIVLIETNGTVKTLKTKELTVDTLYKKCGFRINEDFTCRHTWHVKLAGTSGAGTNAAKEKYIISVWAKKTGKAGGENKYDFPPPIDKDLFFGTCAVVRTKDSEGDFLDLTKETWLKIYEKLFGGFEDIGDEDEYSEDELENVDPSLLTKNGYLKDGFVVSDKELTSGAPSTEDEEDEVKEPAVTVKKKTTKTKPAQAPVKETKQAKEVKETKQAKQVQAPKETKQAKPAQKQTPKETKQAKETKQKETKQAKETQAKQAPAKEVSNSESEETTSELEEEVYTFSDDD